MSMACRLLAWLVLLAILANGVSLKHSIDHLAMAIQSVLVAKSCNCHVRQSIEGNQLGIGQSAPLTEGQFSRLQDALNGEPE